MKKIIIFMVVILYFPFNLPAQGVKNEKDLTQFYVCYLSNIFDDNKLDSLLPEYCTKEFIVVWNEQVNEIGLYDPFTNGISDDYDLIKKTLNVRKEENYYVVSFNYLTWPDNITKKEDVIVHVNDKGKIYRVTRPIDDYSIPEN